MSIKREVKKLIREKLRERFAQYQVVVHWHGVRFHWARDYDDALAWARCVPRDGTVFIVHRGTGTVSARFGSDVHKV